MGLFTLQPHLLQLLGTSFAGDPEHSTVVIYGRPYLSRPCCNLSKVRSRSLRAPFCGCILRTQKAIKSVEAKSSKTADRGFRLDKWLGTEVFAAILGVGHGCTESLCPRKAARSAGIRSAVRPLVRCEWPGWCQSCWNAFAR